MATCQTKISADGFDTICLSNGRMSVSVLPQLGGKIHEIIDMRSGRDWLWKNPHIPLRHPSPNMNYDKELDSGGWDEILFSIEPCDLELPGGDHFSIGDHGSVVDKPWQNIETGINVAGEAVCKLSVEGHTPHFKLVRKMVLHADQPRLECLYRLTNTGNQPWPWLWCAHPLFAVEDDMCIDIQNGQPIRLMQADQALIDADLFWPISRSTQGEKVNLAHIFEKTAKPETFCAKLYVRSANKLSLGTRDGAEGLSLTYDPEKLPWLGLWVNKNGWSGCGSEPYMNLGLEPATTAHESLAEAVAQGHAEFLEPGESKDWSLTVALKNLQNTHD